MRIKIILLTTLFIGIFNFTNAQRGFEGGLKLSAISTQVAGDTYAGFNKFGVSGGAFVSMVYSEKSAIKFEILYSQKGSRNSPNKKGSFNYYRLVLNYIEVPLSYVYSTKHLDFEIGLYYGTLLNSSQDTGSGEQEVTPAYFNYDFGGQFGVNYDLIEDQLAIGIRTSTSILPIRKSPNIPITTQAFVSGGFNSALYLSLGYKF